MDLDRRLYLVVWSKVSVLERRPMDEKYKLLLVKPAVLRSRMAPDTTILEEHNHDQRLIGVFRIPDDARECFAIDLINHILDLNLKPEDQKFQWD